MTLNVFDQLGQTLIQIGRLKEYLQSSVETSEGKVKITIKNIAPEDPGLPQVVFIGVGLRASGAELKYWNATQSNETTKDIGLTRLHTEKYHRLANREFRSINHDSIQAALCSNQPDDVLYPGQWIQYEIDIPVEKAPYIELQVEGMVSPQHLFYSSATFPVETTQFKAIAVEALREYNALEIHRALINVTNHIPAFDENTKFTEVQTLINSLTSAITECETLIGTATQTLYYKYPFPWFQAHAHATFNYADITKKAFSHIKEAVTSNQQYEILTETSKLQTELVEEAYQLNKDTEEIMSRFQITDEEVGYKYRSGIENWDRAAVQRLQTVFSDAKLWALLPDRAKRSMIDADRSWASGSSARTESILNELRIATEELLLKGLWARLEDSEAFQNAQEWHKQRYWDLKAEFLESGAQPSLLCLQRVCKLQVTPAYLEAKGIPEKDIKWFTEELPDSLHRLRQARNIAEHEVTQMSREELQPFVEEFLGKTDQGIFFKIAKILLA